MKIDLKKYDPPGMETDKEQAFFVIGMICCFFYTVLGYLNAYGDEYRDLFYHRGTMEKILRPECTIAPFVEILGNRLMVYLILAVCMLGTVASRYAYYRQGSQSIYLMRRLPDGGLLFRTCWVRPLMRVGMCLLAALVSLAVFYGIYVFVTPAVCLPWN